MRILEELLEIDYYFLSSIERLEGVRLIARIQILAGHIFYIYVYLVFPGLLRYKVVGVHLELGGYSQVL
jgi:hypothetical protein